MAQKKESYWQRRSLKAEKAINDQAKQVESVVIKAYQQAQRYLTLKIRNMFSRSQQRSGLSEDEASKMLNATVATEELVELRRLAKDISNSDLQAEAQSRLTGLAFKERITRAEDLKAKSYLVTKQVADVQLDKQTEFYVDAIHQSYNEASAEVAIRRMEQKDITIETWNKSARVRKGYEFKELSTRYTKNILESHWKGSNYSKRLWSDTEALAKRLEELFTVESMTGMSEFEMAKAIANEFDRSINVARRLIRTEANYMAGQAKLKAWRDRGIEYYRLVVVLDLRTSDICKNISKKKEVYKVVEAVVNGADGNYPPFHPWCRTIAVIFLGEIKGKRIANDPISNQTMTIDQAASYDDWMNLLKEKYSQSEIDLQKLKIINRLNDNVDYLALKDILGKAHSPNSLDNYQEIKYNGSEDWERLKDNFFVKSRLKDGRYGSMVNSEKQAQHMKSTVGKGKSYFENGVDIQSLFDKYAGTGYVERNRSGRRTHKEIILTDDFSGTAVSKEKSSRTKSFKIHHSKNRTHIVPYKGGDS